MKKTIAASCAAASLFAGISYFVYHEVIASNGKVFNIVSDRVRKKKEGDTPPEPDPREVWLDGQGLTEYEMESDDGTLLKGYLLPAKKKTNRYVFCSHGYRSSGKGSFGLIAQFLHNEGCNVFLVDHRGCGDSEGKHITFGNKESRDNLKWLRFMIDTFGDDIEICLYGVSLGSATVMLMTGDEELPENVKFTVADCGYTSAWNQFSNVLNVIGVAKYPLLFGADLCCKTFAGFDFRNTNALESVKHAKIPILFIHGGSDDFIPPVMCYELYEATSAPYKDLL